MANSKTTIIDFLAGMPPFDQLSGSTMSQLAEKCQMLRYKMGQPILLRDTMPSHVIIVFSGQVRLLGYHPQTQNPITLKLLEVGEILGWVSLVRGIACETAIASRETIGMAIPSSYFFNLLRTESFLSDTFRDRPGIIEVFDLLGTILAQRADNEALLKDLGSSDIKELTLKLYGQTVVCNLPSGQTPLSQLDPNLTWLISAGMTINYAVGSCIIAGKDEDYIEVERGGFARLLGIRELPIFTNKYTNKNDSDIITIDDEIPDDQIIIIDDIIDAPSRPIAFDNDTESSSKLLKKYPYVKGRGPLEGAIACFKMLSKHFGTPFRRDVIERLLVNQQKATGNISLQLCGGVGELMGLNVQMTTIPAAAITRLPVPAMITWNDSFAIIYAVSEKEIILASPETGIRSLKLTNFLEIWGEEGQVLFFKSSKDTPKEKFGLSWFLPALKRHHKVLIEVLIASFFVQIFGLANPLVTQLIIDKVLNENGINTLHILGTFLIIIAIVEAVLTTLRTNLFVDTTNRIDLTLGAEIIDHLFRLPLRYFEKRPVGELTTRINELENIRQFLTGTALTVVLDAVFSIVYIIVMIWYSSLLTIVALATLPAFIILTWIVSPIIRAQLRTKAERNAETQSYLVEVLGGIQTVKAQNIELQSRWSWQEKYARYVSAGFNTALTSNTAGSISNFLNKFSGLLLLWVGAFLVLKGELSLGQLIAFRIIAGYTTSPLLRLVQLYQNFQETALSLERLSDIIDSPQEVDEINRNNIPMPAIQGGVKYDNVSFGFVPNGALQLNNINLEFAPGTFVGIVGLSGSGKSTLVKLISRLYEPNSGRILIDDYDINKVELYSLRGQIGMVLQDTLLFNGTVQENIALTNPDATAEEIIESAKISVAHDFIMNLPRGYNTMVGERGSSLSGGQRQRIAIARTVLQKPRFLILDEATSALDYDTERQVCLNLAQVFREQTVFFITHRLNTIKNADLIIMMDKGAVVEQGTHSELIAIKGRYYSLYQQQEATNS